jgi:tetratricopeptide (TPR) repeat protein
MHQPRLIPAARFGALIVLVAFSRPDSVAAYAVAAIALCLVLVPDSALARRVPRWPRPLDDGVPDDFAFGYSLLQSGRSAEAEPWLRRAVEAHGADADARLNLGIALAELGRHDEAVVQLEEAARLRPRDATARYRLGVSSAAVGRHFAAVHALRAAVRLDPRLTAAARALESVGATLSSRAAERGELPPPSRRSERVSEPVVRAS